MDSQSSEGKKGSTERGWNCEHAELIQTEDGPPTAMKGRPQMVQRSIKKLEHFGGLNRWTEGRKPPNRNSGPFNQQKIQSPGQYFRCLWRVALTAICIGTLNGSSGAKGTRTYVGDASTKPVYKA